jgi:hypothetical protein
MRIPHQTQQTFDCPPVTNVELNSECRDRIIPILRGLQHLYSHREFLDQALQWIGDDVLGDADPRRGREGMTLWQILVLAAVRLGCNFTYDHLQDLAENHRALLQIMQVGDWREADFDWRRICDNICKVQPETIEKINHLVVAAGHQLEPAAAKEVRGDSFVAETNVHYPTESSLLLDGLSKILPLAATLAALVGVTGWRQHKSLLKKAKRAAREASRVKKGTNYQTRLKTAYQKLFDVVELVLPRTQELLDAALGHLPRDSENDLPTLESTDAYQELTYWHSVTSHVYGTAQRRILDGERVPNEDKIFSLFEPDTELIKRGKAAQPIQFGHPVLVIEDGVGFICHYRILPIRAQDRDVLIPEMEQLQERLNHRIERGSFDRGFHSPDNQKELARLINHPCVPKSGHKQAARQEAEATIEFRQARQHHPGIESAIHALQSGNGLGRCRDHSQVGYARYIGLGVLGRNLLVLGKLLLARENPKCNAAISKRQKQAA